MKCVYIETYGCSSNQAHAELMSGILADNGMEITNCAEKADIIIINTCIVKGPTENKIRDRIKFILKKYPQKLLVIAGCAADVDVFKNITSNKNVIFLSSHKSKDIAKLLLKNPKNSEKRIRKNNLIGIIEIASGCLGDCSYCIVKLARGKLKSRSINEIKKEVENAVKDDCKEIWLTSQDCGCYGLDIGKNLVDLLKEIISVDYDFKIRIGMMNPTHIKPFLNDLIQIYKNEKVYKFLHIPLQSGSDKILKLMKRGYKTKEFIDLIESFRKEIPNITISTDIIVGFPEESDEDFEKTMEIIKRIKPDIANLSKFNPRPKTEAAKMKQVDAKIINERSIKLAKLIKKISFEVNKKWIGKECEILICEMGKKENQFVGRSESYKPVIVESKDNILGKILKVKIIDAGIGYLVGKIIKT